MQDSLFLKFENTGKEFWQEKVRQELKAGANTPAPWEISDGLLSDPYYTSEELDPRETIRLHHAQKKTNGWLNLPIIGLEKPVPTNHEIRTALTNGAQGIFLEFATKKLAEAELTKTLHQVRLSDHFVFFATDENPADLFSLISKGAPYYLKGGIAADPAATFLHSAEAATSALDSIGSVILKTSVMRDFRPYMIESHLYHDSGADAVQELAFTISALVRCVDHLTDHGISPFLALNRFFFSVSVDTDYLQQIAKLRALRMLYRNITRAYQLPDELCIAFIHAKTSSLRHTSKSSETNLIRATIEAMAGINGGCDALTVGSHDESTGAFGARIARNISSLVNAETYAGYVNDPAAGSYLIDKLSLAMADQAWALFLKMESMGGLHECYQSGFIQNQIENSWARKIELVKGDKILVGVNKYQEQGAKKEPGQRAALPIRNRALPKRSLEDVFAPA